MGVSTPLCVCVHVCQLVSGLQSCDWCWQVLLPSQTHAHTLTSHPHLSHSKLGLTGLQDHRLNANKDSCYSRPTLGWDRRLMWQGGIRADMSSPRLVSVQSLWPAEGRDKENSEGGPGEVTNDEVSQPVRLKNNTKDKNRSQSAETRDTKCKKGT